MPNGSFETSLALAKRDIDMRPPLPKGWVWTHLSAIAALKGGITKGQKRKSQDILSSVPYLRVANVQRGYLDLAEIKQIEATEDEIKELRLFPGDILFNEGGDRDKLGRGWVWRGEIPECIHQNHVFRARLYVPELQPKLISWYGNSFGQRYFISEGKQTTNLASINLTKLGALPIPLPPINEQHRIVAEIETQFSRLDAVVNALKRVQANLKRYRASVLQAACEGRLVPTEAELARTEGRAYESADELLQRILQERRAKWESEQLTAMQAEGKIPRDERWKSKYREPATPDTRKLLGLPEGWVWTTVEQVGHVQLGRQRAPKYHHGEHMRPYLRVANVFEDRIDTNDILHMNFTPEEFRTYCLQHGDVLLNEGQSLELVGRPAMYRDEVPGACFQNTLVRFRSYQGLTSSFALCVFRSYLHNGRFQRIAKWTTNIAHLGAGRFAEIEFPLPPLIEQQRILAEVERRFSIMDELEATIATNLKRTDRLRQAILKCAFEGKLVPQDPTDEPASVLLERIRLEREHPMEKPKATPQQTQAPQPTGQPRATTSVQGELALEFRQ